MVTADAAGLEAVSRRLMEAGQVEIYRALRTDVVAATKDAKSMVVQSAIDTLPKEGGLNEWVADDLRVTTTVVSTGVSAGVSIRTGKTGHDIKDMDAGQIRKPVFGNRKVWRPQEITPGFVSKPMRDLQVPFLAACEAAQLKAATAAGFI